MKTARIIVVDDEEATLRSIAMALEKGGYEVTCVPSGEAALQAITGAQAAGNQFDLLVSDMGLPNISGIELVDRFGNLGIRLPSLIITGQVDDELIERLKRNGGTVLPKPFHGGQLLELVAAALGGPVQHS